MRKFLILMSLSFIVIIGKVSASTIDILSIDIKDDIISVIYLEDGKTKKGNSEYLETLETGEHLLLVDDHKFVAEFDNRNEEYIGF